MISWGRSDYGQLGLGDDIVSQGCCYLPQEIPHIKHPKQVHQGLTHSLYTYFSLFVTVGILS